MHGKLYWNKLTISDNYQAWGSYEINVTLTIPYVVEATEMDICELPKLLKAAIDKQLDRAGLRPCFDYNFPTILDLTKCPYFITYDNSNLLICAPWVRRRLIYQIPSHAAHRNAWNRWYTSLRKKL